MKAKRAPKTLPYHPLANLFPLLQGRDYESLCANIAANGQLHPIVLCDGKILDGRNRYRACIDLKIEPWLDGDAPVDPLGYVLASNLHRRHLNESQRAMVAARLATMPVGRPDNSANLRTTQAEAAALLNVSPRSVTAAERVQAHAATAIVARVDAGEIAVSVAANVAKLSLPEQTRLAHASEAELRGAGKKAGRAQRERDLAQATARASSELGSKLYGVIYADPPWRFEPYSRETGMDRAPDNHYPTMTLAEIGAIEVPAAADAALFLWATMPMLPDALTIMAAWGFSYRSGFIWIKDKIGLGYWARNRHELLLLGTRGNIPAPAPGDQYDSVIAHATEQHSAKPLIFAEMIEQMFPNTALLEMFARSPRAGWDVWGNESAKVAA